MMNQTKLNGMALIGIGRLHHAAGLLLRNRRMQAAGFALEIAGQSQLAIGSAMLRIGSRLGN